MVMVAILIPVTLIVAVIIVTIVFATSAASILSMSATTVSSPKKRSETAPIAQTEQRIRRITGIAQIRIEALVVLRLLNWKNGSTTVTLVIKILVSGSLSRLWHLRGETLSIWDTSRVPWSRLVVKGTGLGLIPCRLLSWDVCGRLRCVPICRLSRVPGGALRIWIKLIVETRLS